MGPLAASDFLRTTEPLGGGVTLERYIYAATAIAAAMILRKVVSVVANRWLKRLADRIPGTEDDRLLLALHRPFTYIMFVVGLYVGLHMLQPSAAVAHVMAIAFRTVMVVAVLWLLLRVVDVVGFFLRWKPMTGEPRLDDHVVLLMRTGMKIFLYAVAAINILDALGQDVGAVVAGLGLGGLAFALAAKDTIANILGSITIFMDKPFRIGDWVVVEGTEGVVETLGLRCTRIRTFEKTLVSIPNSEMVIKKIDNISQRPHRKVTMTIGVSFETTRAQMVQVLESLRDMLRTNESVEKDNFFVNFTGFGDSSLEIKIIYWVIYPDYGIFLTVCEAMNLEILRRLEAAGVEIAFPSRTVYLKNVSGGAAGN